LVFLTAASETIVQEKATTSTSVQTEITASDFDRILSADKGIGKHSVKKNQVQLSTDADHLMVTTHNTCDNSGAFHLTGGPPSCTAKLNRQPRLPFFEVHQLKSLAHATDSRKTFKPIATTTTCGASPNIATSCDRKESKMKTERMETSKPYTLSVIRVSATQLSADLPFEKHLDHYNRYCPHPASSSGRGKSCDSQKRTLFPRKPVPQSYATCDVIALNSDVQGRAEESSEIDSSTEQDSIRWSSDLASMQTLSDKSSEMQKSSVDSLQPHALSSSSLEGITSRKNSLVPEQPFREVRLSSLFRNTPSPLVITKLKTASELLEECRARRTAHHLGRPSSANLSKMPPSIQSRRGSHDVSELSSRDHSLQCARFVRECSSTSPTPGASTLSITDDEITGERTVETVIGDNLCDQGEGMHARCTNETSLCSKVVHDVDKISGILTMDSSSAPSLSSKQTKTKTDDTKWTSLVKRPAPSASTDGKNILGALSLSALSALSVTVATPSGSQLQLARPVGSLQTCAKLSARDTSGVASPEGASLDRTASEDDRPHTAKTRFLEGRWFQRSKKFFKS